MKLHSSCFAIAVRLLGNGKQSGKEIAFSCPNHDDKHPSLSVNREKNCWYCFPCQKGGGWWRLAAFIAGVSPEDKRSVAAFLNEKGL